MASPDEKPDDAPPPQRRGRPRKTYLASDDGPPMRKRPGGMPDPIVASSPFLAPITKAMLQRRR